MIFTEFQTYAHHELNMFFMKYGHHPTNRKVYMGYEDKRKLQQSVIPGSYNLYEETLEIWGFEIIEVNKVHYFDMVLR